MKKTLLSVFLALPLLMGFEDGEVVHSKVPTMWCDDPQTFHRSADVLENTGNPAEAYKVMLDEGCFKTPPRMSFQIQEVVESRFITHEAFNGTKKFYILKVELGGEALYTFRADPKDAEYQGA